MGQSIWGGEGARLLSPAALPVALAADHQGVTVVGESIQCRAGQQPVAERFRPLLEGAVAGEHGGPALVALANQLVQVLGHLGGQRAQTHAVEREQVCLRPLRSLKPPAGRHVPTTDNEPGTDGG